MQLPSALPERTVVVVVDDLADGDAAVARVLAQAGGKPIDLHLLNVQPPLGANASRFIDRGTIRRFQLNEGYARVEGIRGPLRRDGVRCLGHVQVGDAPRCIDALARRIAADQVVIAAKSVGLMGRALFALWAHRIQRHCTVPVALLPAAASPPARGRLAWRFAFQR